MDNYYKMLARDLAAIAAAVCLTTAVLLMVLSPVHSAAQIRNEASYVEQWCDEIDGGEEFRLVDDTRVDCLTDTHAVEFDFSYKWAECTGQSVYYARLSGSRGLCVLIKKEGVTDFAFGRHVVRARTVANIANIDIACLDEDGEEFKCPE